LYGVARTATKILGYARSDMDRTKFETQLTSGIEEDEKAGITKPDEEAKKKFKALAEYVRGQYDVSSYFFLLMLALRYTRVGTNEHRWAGGGSVAQARTRVDGRGGLPARRRRDSLGPEA
jgi:glucose-6-phosphate 1-dehydrogenase